MRIVIDIEEQKILKYGTIVIHGATADPVDNMEVSIPGFRMNLTDDKDTAISVRKHYGDSRDATLVTGGKNEKTDGAQGASSNGGNKKGKLSIVKGSGRSSKKR